MFTVRGRGELQAPSPPPPPGSPRRLRALKGSQQSPALRWRGRGHPILSPRALARGAAQGAPGTWSCRKAWPHPPSPCVGKSMLLSGPPHLLLPAGCGLEGVCTDRLRTSLAAKTVKKHSFPLPSSSFLGELQFTARQSTGFRCTAEGLSAWGQSRTAVPSRNWERFHHPRRRAGAPQRSAPVSPRPPASGNRYFPASMGLHVLDNLTGRFPSCGLFCVCCLHLGQEPKVRR